MLRTTESSSMSNFKVSLVVLDEGLPLEEVHQQFAQESIDFSFHHCTTGDEIMQHAAGADVVWLYGGSYILTAERLVGLPQCGAILRPGSGTDNIPISAATQSGIIVANTPDAHRDEVSDHTLGLLFALVREIAVQDRAVRTGMWDAEYAYPQWNFQNKTLGLVGFGRIGQLVARKLSGYEMQVLVHDTYIKDNVIKSHGAQPVEFDELLAQSDIISLNCPLTPETHHLIGRRELQQMKSSAILINTARGKIVEEPALVEALTDGWIAGAGLDVLETEPPDPTHPLFTLNNVVITPHTAGYSDRSMKRCWQLSVESVIDLKNGFWPRSVVNSDVKPRWTLRHRDRPEAT